MIPFLAAAACFSQRGPVVAMERVFDPADFIDQSTYAKPHQYPSGSRTTVLVNGVPVVMNARHTGATPGKVLRLDSEGRVG